MFELIDDKLYEWAKSKKLHIYTKDREVEIRSINIVTPKGNKYQLWLEILPKKVIKIVVWDMGKWSAEYKVSIDIFEDTLDLAHYMVSFWDNYK